MAGPVTGVSALVVEMQDLLATIQNTLASLDPNVQDAKLDELERKRDDAIEALSNAYLAESELLNRKRKAEREALAEQRRKEDEERERRRHEEDEKLAARDRDEDQARDGRFKEDTEEVEEEMDGLMNLVEEEARIAAAEGREKIRAMQERRRELNRLIEEQLETLPTTIPVAPPRARRPTRTGASKPSLPTNRKLEPIQHLETEHQLINHGVSQNMPGITSIPAGHVAMDAAKLDLPPEAIAHEHGHHSTDDESPAAYESEAVGVAHGGKRDLQKAPEIPEPLTTSDKGLPESPEPLPSSPPDAATSLVTEAAARSRGQPAETKPGEELQWPQPESPRDEEHLTEVAAAERDNVGSIPGTMNHRDDVPGMVGGDAVRVLMEGKKDSAGDLSTNKEPESHEAGQVEDVSEPLGEPTTVYEDHADQEDYRGLTGPDVSRVVERGDPNATTDTTAPTHEHPGHRPEISVTTTKDHSKPLGHYDFSDREEISSVSSGGTEQEGVYPHVSEVSGPAFTAYQDEANSLSGYVSEDIDIQDTVFSRPEAYIEEDDLDDTEHLRLYDGDIEDKEEEGFDQESGNEKDLAAEADFERHHHPSTELPERQATPEHTGAQMETLEEESEEMDEDEEVYAPKPELEHLPSPTQEVNGGMVPGSEREMDLDQGEPIEPVETIEPAERVEPAEPTEPVETVETVGPVKNSESVEPSEGVEAVEPERAVHDTVLQTSEDTVEEAETPKLSQGDGLFPVDEGTSSDLGGHGDGHRDLHPHEEQADYQGYPSSPEPSHGGHADLEHEEPASYFSHETYRHHGSEDEDTDTDSQRFVTPLPSHQALRAFSQQQANLPRGVDTDDYIGSQHYAPEDTRQYELEHQHSTTVHGQDELFDDTDRSEGRASIKDDDAAEHADTSRQGTPVWRPSPAHSGQAEEAYMGSYDDERMIADVEIEGPTSLDNLDRAKNWAEEAGTYIEDEDKHELRPETPPQQMDETTKAAVPHDDSPSESPHEPPSPTSSGAAATRHDPERPQTPTEHASLASEEYVTPEPLAARDTTKITPWRGNDGWTPQSRRTHSTSPSPPPSPPHTVSADKHEPDISRHLENESPIYREHSYSSPQLTEHGHFNDDTEDRTPVTLMAPWEGRESPELGLDHPRRTDTQDSRHSTTTSEGGHNEGGNSGSLFRRMRSIFEQPRGSISSHRDSSYAAAAAASDRARSRPSSDTWFAENAALQSPTQAAGQRRFSPLPSPTMAGERSSLLAHNRNDQGQGQNDN